MSKTKATGVISKNPVITKLRGGRLAGNLFVTVKDVGEVKCFYDDPEDLNMFSFQKGDEVKVEWWKKDQWLNGKILTPKGSADAETALEFAVIKLNGGSATGDGSILDDMAAIIVLCREAIIHAGIEDTFEEGLSPDTEEETIRTAAMALFIEVNRSGIDYASLLD